MPGIICAKYLLGLTSIFLFAGAVKNVIVSKMRELKSTNENLNY